MESVYDMHHPLCLSCISSSEVCKKMGVFFGGLSVKGDSNFSQFPLAQSLFLIREGLNKELGMNRKDIHSSLTLRTENYFPAFFQAVRQLLRENRDPSHSSWA